VRYKYGFSWFHLVLGCLLCAPLGLVMLWLALTNQAGWEIAGIEFSSAGFRIIILFIGGSFTYTAWLLLTIMRRQSGMQDFVWLDGDSLHLPVMKLGSVLIPCQEITELTLLVKPAQKILEIHTSQQRYQLESRMMQKPAFFDTLAAAIKAQAPQAVFTEIGKK